jgi:MGT family glycosyltransferase
VKLLLITPDYLSHYLPMSAIAAEAARRDIAVTVATGPTLGPRVGADGWSWRPLLMSRGSNAGIKRIDDPDDDLRAFFTVTRQGMVPTLMLQAEARGDDLLWNPLDVGRAVLAIVEELRPDAILVDHLAFAASMALLARQVPFTTFVPGHPSQLPSPGERYGYPVSWPRCITPDDGALARLWDRCDTVTEQFTDRYRRAATAIGGSCADVSDAFAMHGEDVLYNSPPALQDPARPNAEPSAFLGACVRDEQADGDVRRWLDADDGRPLVYVSFGTFLSARHDVLRQVLRALGELDVRVAVATGPTTSATPGPLPDGWLARPTLPQIAILQHAAAVVTHGGNNTVTESLAAAAPLVTMPFSTDQFAIAADLERTALGAALDPNRVDVATFAHALEWALSADTQERVMDLAAGMARRPGPVIALDRMCGTSSDRAAPGTPMAPDGGRVRAVRR